MFVPVTSPSMLKDSSRVFLVTSSIAWRLYIVPVPLNLTSVVSNPTSNVAFFLKYMGKLKF